MISLMGWTLFLSRHLGKPVVDRGRELVPRDKPLGALGVGKVAFHVFRYSLMSIAEIETAIKGLPPEELAQFDQWYHDYLEEQWDEQIRADLRGGKLDSLRAEVRAAEAAGTLRSFP
jgi:hypothetical protein